LKVDRRNREEVEGDDRFSVILQKRQPLFPRIAATSDAPQIAGDRAFGNDEAKLLQLAMDLGGCCPQKLRSRACLQPRNIA